MITVTTRDQLKEALDRMPGHPRGFVPTMGALHAGHISLVERARADSNVVVVSVFVNPTQFNDASDLQNYPRTPEDDLRLLEEAGADIVFMPAVADIYPEPDTRIFTLDGMANDMEGATRPGHFNGVAQVVSRLFDLVRPDAAYFGEKDFQQVAVIRALCRECGYTTDIINCPTVREPDGLAMSSRNSLLDTGHRAAAPAIYKAMNTVANEVRTALDTDTPVEIGDAVQRVTDLINSEPLLNVIYFSLVDAYTLRPATGWDSPGGVQGCVAVQAGNVRLIDNLRFV